MPEVIKTHKKDFDNKGIVFGCSAKPTLSAQCAAYFVPISNQANKYYMPYRFLASPPSYTNPSMAPKYARFNCQKDSSNIQDTLTLFYPYATIGWYVNDVQEDLINSCIDIKEKQFN